jgi:hypothetical protein
MGATGTWTEAMSAAPFVDVQAPAPADVPVHGGRIERRDGSHGLRAAVDAVLHSDQGPAWIAWREPAVARPHDHGWNDAPGRCVLDDDGDFHDGNSFDSRTTDIVLLGRAYHGALDRLTFSDGRCTVDAGTRCVYWLDGVTPVDSIGLLDGMVTARAKGSEDEPEHHGNHRDPAKHAVGAIALHRDPAADRVLERYVAAGNPRWLRQDAAFWLGAARGEAGAAIVIALARTDPDDAFRQHLTFVLTLTGDAGVDTLFDLARHDASSGVRSQALFWVAQKAGQKAVAALGDAVANDPNSEVRKRAVFAISQLPKDDGVPKLIELAKSHRDPEVRKQAMFWLGQSGDPRAIAFFESVLRQ